MYIKLNGSVYENINTDGDGDLENGGQLFHEFAELFIDLKNRKRVST
jgi:hypothetical protein